MNVASLSKEQKQYMILGALVGGIALYSLFTFVLTPMKTNWSEATQEVGDLQSKVDEAERMIGNKAKLAANLEESNVVMASASASYMPDPANPLAWATRTLYAVGRDIGVDIQAVAELGPSAVLVKQNASGDRAFGVYAVRVETECGYELLKVFLRALEERNPYVCVSGISIERNINQPEQHGVNMTLEWPAWGASSPQTGLIGEKGV